MILKKIGRIGVLALALILVIFSFPTVCAGAAGDTVSYEIEELSMTMDIPQSIGIITSSVKQNDPIFKGNGLDYIETMSKLRENNDYLYGKDFTLDFEFEVMADENQNGVSNLKKLSEKKLEALKDDILQQENVFSAAVYQSENFIFIEIMRNTTDADGRKFSKEYYTVYNEMDIILRITSVNDNLSDTELNIIREITDSVKFPSDRKFTIKGKLTSATVVPFTLICVCFVILAYNKIKSLQKEKMRAERRKNREENRKKEESSMKDADNSPSAESSERKQDDSKESDSSKAVSPHVSDNAEKPNSSEASTAASDNNNSVETAADNESSIEQESKDIPEPVNIIPDESEASESAEKETTASDIVPIETEKSESVEAGEIHVENVKSSEKQAVSEITVDNLSENAENIGVSKPVVSESENEEKTPDAESDDPNDTEKHQSSKDSEEHSDYENVDLEAAIANFESSSENRKNRRENPKTKSKKKFCNYSAPTHQI